MSRTKQLALLWWSVGLLIGYGIALVALMQMLPPPGPDWADERIKDFYDDNSTRIRMGAVLASWTGAFLAPFFVVLGAQALRVERGRPIWATVIAALGSLTTVFFVFPPIYWGVAAFDPDRSAEATVLMHELGALTLVTSDQYFIFPLLAVIVLCYSRPRGAATSAFPRWFGHLTVGVMALSQLSAFAFLTQDGAFAYDGIVSFWGGFAVMGVWLAVAYALLFRALAAQPGGTPSVRPTDDRASAPTSLDGVTRS